LSRFLRINIPALSSLLVTVLLTAGCAGIRVPAEGDQSAWRMTGKLSLVTSSESRVLGIDWLQRGDRSEIKLAGPLGVSVARITALPGQLLINDGREIRRFDDAVSLSLADGATLRLPWQRLRFWVQGLQAGGNEVIPGMGMRDGDWQLRILRADKQGPRMLLLEHPEVTLRLKVRNWHFQGPIVPINDI
jgi:outer membrane biogenesis lipoprotein LolB